MKIQNEILNNWKAKASVRGIKFKCSYKTKITRQTIDRVLATGSASAGVYAVLDKFFKSIK